VRRFVIVLIIVMLVVGLGASLAGNVLLYAVHQMEQNEAEAVLQARATRIAGLEQELGNVQTDLRRAERQMLTLEAHLSSTPSPDPISPDRPVVEILSPAPGDRFKEGEVVVVRWTTHSQDQLAWAQFLVDGSLVVRTDFDGETQIEGRFTWEASGTGSHVLEIRASNTEGLESDWVRVEIEVISDGTRQKPIAPEIAAAMAEIERQAVVLRGLAPLQPITVAVYSRAELRQQVLEELDRDLPPDEATATAVEMAAFDFLPASTDLRALLAELYTEQIAGYYDTDTASFALIDDDDALGPLDKATYTHEFIHALQDQHYDLDSLDPGDSNDDASLAVTGLIEGDAMLVMQQYMYEHLSPQEIFELLSESQMVETTALDQAPMVIREQLLFPYVSGLAFVQALHSRGGFAAVDEAFRNPPQSTEQILHPQRYLAGELPRILSLPPLTDTLGAGWHWVDSNVLGEYTLRLYLEQQVDPALAAKAADGWGGDWYSVYTRPGTSDIVLVWRTAWDREVEAAEFADVYTLYANARFGSPPVSQTCWSGADAICFYRSGEETLVIRAPDLELVRELAALFPDLSG